MYPCVRHLLHKLTPRAILATACWSCHCWLLLPQHPHFPACRVRPAILTCSSLVSTVRRQLDHDGLLTVWHQPFPIRVRHLERLATVCLPSLLYFPLLPQRLFHPVKRDSALQIIHFPPHHPHQTPFPDSIRRFSQRAPSVVPSPTPLSDPSPRSRNPSPSPRGGPRTLLIDTARPVLPPS